VKTVRDGGGLQIRAKSGSFTSLELMYRFVYVNNTIVAMYVYIPKIHIAV
jgi:hypothetical protein